MLKSWSKLEKILLFGSIIIISAVGFIFKSDLLTTVCAISYGFYNWKKLEKEQRGE